MSSLGLSSSSNAASASTSNLSSLDPSNLAKNAGLARSASVPPVASNSASNPASNPNPNSATSFAPDQTVIPNLGAYVNTNSELALFNNHPALKRVVPIAVDRAIREIIQPVVERSVTIACITSKVSERERE